MTTIIAAARALLDSIEFDDSGTLGQGGNGGLLSPKTIRLAGALRQSIARQETPHAAERATRKTPPEGTIPPDSAWQPESRT